MMNDGFKRLLCSLLINTLSDAADGVKEARDWIFNTNGGYVIDIIDVCEWLGIDANVLRAAVKTNKIKMLVKEYNRMHRTLHHSDQ